MATTSATDTFAERWNTLERAERLRLRRLARMGRTSDDPELAQLAPAYARFQMNRPWMRLFWLWFPPAMLFALLAAAGIHPILVGVVIALGAQAAYAAVSLRKLARRVS